MLLVWYGVYSDKVKAITLLFNSNQNSVIFNINRSIGSNFVPALPGNGNPKLAFQNIVDKHRNLSGKYNILCRLSPDKMPVQASSDCLQKVVESYDNWMETLSQLIAAFKLIEPGFMITSFTWKKEGHRDQKFFYVYRHLEENLLTIGKENIATLNIFTLHLKLYDKLHTEFLEFADLKKNRAYNGKINKLRRFQEALQVLPLTKDLSALEQQALLYESARVKIKLLAYESMSPDLKVASEYVETWKELAQGLKEAIDFFIKAGQAERDEVFMAAYSYLNK